MTTSKRLQGRRLLPDKVRNAELEYLRRRREAAGLKESCEDIEGNLVGLCLSGGGIRSATFCLGVLQAMTSRGLLKFVDYVSTVSGGGYLGSCLSSLTTIRAPEQSDREERDEEREERIRRGNEYKLELHRDGDHLRAESQVHHLRTHGDFLVTRQGLIRREVLRAIGSTTLGVSCTLFMFLIVLHIVVGLLFGLGSWLGGEGIWAKVRAGDVGGLWVDLLPDPASGIWIGLAALVGAVVSGITAWEFNTWKPEKKGTPGSTKDDREGMRRVCRYFLYLGGALLFVLMAATLRGSCSAGSMLLLPAAVAAGAVFGASLCFVVSAVYLGFLSKAIAWNIQSRSTLAAMRGASQMVLLFCIAIPGVFFLIAWLVDGGLGTLLGSVVSLVATGVAAKGGGSAASDSGLKARLMARLPAIVLALAVPVLILSGIVLVALIYLPCAESDAWFGVRWLPLPVALFLVLGWLLDLNRISPHYFYRDRLAETYLRTEGPDLRYEKRRRRDGEVDRLSRLIVRRDDHDLLLRDLHDWSAGGAGNPYPYQLITASLNLPGSNDLRKKDQKSDHFLFSREYVGSCTTGYVQTGEYCRGRIGLAAAMTISGAAIASVMGYHTSFARSFAAALFNVRVGFWYPNPDWFLRPRGRKKPHERWIFWPALVALEMGAATNARGPMVNLSDGGHTGDNLGLKPLLQRRVKLIVVVDAERDPDYGFGSLSRAMRQVFAEENVVVDFDIDDIRPKRDKKGKRRKYARSHFAVGRIRYPDDGLEGTPSEGVLLVIKSSYTDRDEPTPVKTYAADHADFPHQTTVDQFFDDDQFESYRQLGRHIAGQVWCRAIWPDRPPGEHVGRHEEWGLAECLALARSFCPSEASEKKCARPWQDEELLRRAWEKHEGNPKAVGDEMGVTPKTIQKWAAKFGLK